MAYIGAIGSRDIGAVEEEIPLIYALAIQFAVVSGFIIKTGAAPGFDQLAAQVALESNGNVLLVLPWENFQKDWIKGMEGRYPGKVEYTWYNPKNPEHKPWMDSVSVYHPAPRTLKPYMYCLHARNYGIVEGTTAVIAAPRGLEEGGTGQGIRICRGTGTTLYNLSVPKDREILLCRMGANSDGTPR